MAKQILNCYLLSKIFFHCFGVSTGRNEQYEERGEFLYSLMFPSYFPIANIIKVVHGIP